MAIAKVCILIAVDATTADGGCGGGVVVVTVLMVN